MNIILVSSATSRARTLTLDWRHAVSGGFALFVLFIGFTLAFNFVTLRYAAATHHPWLQAIVLADQREEAQKSQEIVQGHLNAMALRLGDLQAQMMRLDGLGSVLPRSPASNRRNCNRCSLARLRPGAARSRPFRRAISR